MKYLYKRVPEKQGAVIPEGLCEEIFDPTIRRLFVRGERKSVKAAAVRLLFRFITYGKARIYVYKQNEKVVHTSYVIPRCCKFAFLGENDYQIGPCFTYPEYRGMGYYPAMLRHICATVGSEETVFYMSVDESNAASIRGIEKAGFERIGNVKVTGLMKRYRIDPESMDR